MKGIDTPVARRRLFVDVIIAVFLVASVPACFADTGNSFDERWIYFLNFARKDEYVFGRNVIFNYGPLGFLSFVRSVKDSLFRGLAFWAVIYAAFVYLFLQIRRNLLRSEGRAASCLVALLLFLLPQKLAPDVLVNFYVWLAVALLLDCGGGDRRFVAYALIADVLTAMLFLWKTSAFASSFASCIIAAALLGFFRREYGKALLLLLSIPCIVCGYLVYNPSLADFAGWCRGAVEISGGYNSVLGNVMTEEPFTAFFVVFGVAAGICLAVCLCLRGKKPFSLFLPLFIPLFFFYKYGIVRHGGYAFYQGVCMAFSIFFLLGLFDFLLPSCAAYGSAGTEGEAAGSGGGASGLARRPFAGWAKASLAYVLLLCVLEFPSFLTSIPACLKASTLELPSQIIDNYLLSVRNPVGKELDPRFKALVGDGTVAIFPDELFYLGNDDVRFKAMPVIQTNVAYTPWLDGKNASFFEEEAPDFVLLGLETLDMRLPLLETPATYAAIRENYELVAGNATELLFRKKAGDAPREGGRRQISAVEWTGSPVGRPEGSARLSVEMKLSLLGRLAEFFWKSLPVFMDIRFDDGSVNGGRIVPNTAVTPIAVDELVVPYSGVHPREDGAAELLAAAISDPSGKRAISVDFRMKSLVRLYYKDIQVCWWE